MIPTTVKYSGLKRALERAVVGFALASIAYWAVTMVWWRAGNYDSVLPTVEQPIKVNNLNREVALDEELHLTVVVDKPVDLAPVNVGTGFHCNNRQFYSAIPSNPGWRLPAGKFILDTYFKFPENMPANVTCYFQFTQDYQVNPIRLITRTWNSEPFDVKE